MSWSSLTSLRFYCATKMWTASGVRERDGLRDGFNRLLETACGQGEDSARSSLLVW
jgi:hypothetical protein